MNLLANINLEEHSEITEYSHQDLIEYTAQTIEFLVSITNFFMANPTLDYRQPVGAHIRHLLDHYDALLRPKSDKINYDNRMRNPQIEMSPLLAKHLLLETLLLVKRIELSSLHRSIEVFATIGQTGETQVQVTSSLGRELIFFNSHTVHHLAIIKPHCLEVGMKIDSGFGVAPSTLAHQLRHQD